VIWILRQVDTATDLWYGHLAAQSTKSLGAPNTDPNPYVAYLEGRGDRPNCPPACLWMPFARLTQAHARADRIERMHRSAQSGAFWRRRYARPALVTLSDTRWKCGRIEQDGKGDDVVRTAGSTCCEKMSSAAIQRSPSSSSAPELLHICPYLGKTDGVVGEGSE
jgi:hypothetical protein